MHGECTAHAHATTLSIGTGASLVTLRASPASSFASHRYGYKRNLQLLLDHGSKFQVRQFKTALLLTSGFPRTYPIVALYLDPSQVVTWFDQTTALKTTNVV